MQNKICKMCSEALGGKQSVWCSKRCSKRFFRIQWRTRYPDKYKAECKKYRQKTSQYYVKKTLKSRNIRLDDKCRRCGTGDNLTINHIKPKCIGGSDHLSNIEVLCGPCNRAEYHALVRLALKMFFEAQVSPTLLHPGKYP